jgi:hypothetical protein
MPCSCPAAGGGAAKKLRIVGMRQHYQDALSFGPALGLQYFMGK